MSRKEEVMEPEVKKEVTDTTLNEGNPQGGTPAQEQPTTGTPTDGVPPKDGMQSRIDELTRKRREAERDAAYWRGRAESSNTAPKQPEPEPEPDLDPNDFDSDADYLRAVAKKTRDEILSAHTKQEKERVELENRSSLVSQYQKAREKYPDFDEVGLNPNLPVTTSMFEAAQGPLLGDVLQHLGKNPAEAARISSLPAAQQIKEIGKIEVLLSTPKPTQITNAPNPVTTVGGGGAAPPAKPDSEKSRSELRAEWEAERRRKAGVK
jgi:hypothetical protein